MSSCVYEHIKSTGNLPSPDGIALEIMRVSQNPKSTIEDAAAVIQRDPASTARIMKYVNSPMAGLANRIASLKHAVSLLGLQTTTNLALGYSLLSQDDLCVCQGFDYARFWSGSLARATAVRYLARHFAGLDINEAFTCGLLSHIGQLALATAYPDKYALALMSCDRDMPLDSVERQLFLIDHYDLTAEMMLEWRMPVHFCEAVRMQGDRTHFGTLPESQAEQLAMLLYVGRIIAELFCNPEYYFDDLSQLMEVASCARVAPEEFGQAFDSIREDWQAMGDVFSVETHDVALWSGICGMAV